MNNKVLNGLKDCLKAHEDGCDTCPYKKDGCEASMHADAFAQIENDMADMEKMRIEVAELTERCQILEKELYKERAYNSAIINVINSKFSS